MALVAIDCTRRTTRESDCGLCTEMPDICDSNAVDSCFLGPKGHTFP